LKAEGFNALADWLIQEKITIYHSAATLFRRFTGELDSDVQFPQMRVIRLGGESVSWRDVEVYKKHFPESCVLANELSCSETNTFSQFLINKQAEFKLIIPVGYPVEDKDVIILDENGNPLDDGDIGEIAIRSRYLSPGYWNRPDLTDLAFTSDPKSTTSRIYRTGDLGRKSADGCLEHLGRKDARIKIRGYRVECHEIELALLQNPTVNQAFVTHGQDAQNESHLIAYLVCIKRPSFNISDLRADLSKRLPSYMVPASFVFLDALPLTPTGKIDRSALPVPDFKRSAFAECYEPPRNAIEKSLAAICSEILNISTIGVCDNLFDLGGHSLSAMQIVARVMKTFRIEVPLKSFYDAPTIAGLSAVITSCRGITAADEDTALAQDLIKLPTVIDSDSRIESLRTHSPISLPALYAVARQRPILPSIAQEPILRLAQLFPGLHQFNVSTAYRLRGPLNLLILKQSLTRLIERHETLHTVFSVENGKRYQSIIESLSNNLDVIDFRELPETERESKAKELFREEFQRPFDLAYGPLFRVTVFRLSDDDHILAVTVHQAISDGWSMVIFFRDLAEFYRSALQANQSQLPDLPVQYADFAVWQRDVLQVGLMDRQLAYWKNQLSQPLIPLEFSTRSRQSDEMSFFTARKRFSISGKLYQSVKSLAREEKITPYIVLLTALNILLFRYFEEEDIRVGTLVANRLQTEVENVIGHFVNTVILRTRVLKHLNFKNLAQRIREVVVSAHSNQDIPFEVLLQSLENESTIRCDTLSPVLFIFQGLPPPVILPNLTVSVLEDFQSATAPEIALTTFDLVFSIKEGSEGLTGFVLYKIFVLDEMMITRFMRNFEDLLERLVYDPNESVYTLCSSVEI
jgi:acyl carrier protein